MSEESSFVGLIFGFIFAGGVMSNFDFSFWWVVKDIPMVLLILFFAGVAWFGAGVVVDRVFRFGWLKDGYGF